MKYLIVIILCLACLIGGYLYGEHRSKTELPAIERDTTYERSYVRDSLEYEALKAFRDSVRKAPRAVTSETVQKIKDKYEKANVSDTAFDGWVLSGADRWQRYIDSVQSQTGTDDTLGGMRKD